MIRFELELPWERFSSSPSLFLPNLRECFTLHWKVEKLEKKWEVKCIWKMGKMGSEWCSKASELSTDRLAKTTAFKDNCPLHILRNLDPICRSDLFSSHPECLVRNKTSKRRRERTIPIHSSVLFATYFCRSSNYSNKLSLLCLFMCLCFMAAFSPSLRPVVCLARPYEWMLEFWVIKWWMFKAYTWWALLGCLYTSSRVQLMRMT